jgi:hypothetical protein
MFRIRFYFPAKSICLNVGSIFFSETTLDTQKFLLRDENLLFIDLTLLIAFTKPQAHKLHLNYIN